jgi:hypothetical protein
MEIRKKVFTNLEYPLPIMAKPYFERPVLTLNLEAVCEIIPQKMSEDDLEDLEVAVGKKQQTVIDQVFDAAFTKALFEKAAPRIKKIQKTIDGANALINGNKAITDEALNKIVGMTNKDIESFGKELENIMIDIANKSLEKAVESSFKDMKKRIKKAKGKCVGKVIAKYLLKATNAVLEKIGDVLTESGKLAPLGIFVQALAKGVSVAEGKIDPHWPTTANAIRMVNEAAESIGKDSELLEKVLVEAAPQKVRGQYYEVPAKIQNVAKALVARVFGSTELITKSVGQLDKFKGALIECYAELIKQYNGAVAKMDKVDSKTKGILGAQAAFIKSEAKKITDKLRNIDKAADDANAILAHYRDMKACFDAFYNLKSPGDATKQLGKIKGTLANLKQKAKTIKAVVSETDLVDSSKRSISSIKKNILSVS